MKTSPILLLLLLLLFLFFNTVSTRNYPRYCKRAPNWTIKGFNPILDETRRGNIVVLSLIKATNLRGLLYHLRCLEVLTSYYIYTASYKVAVMAFNDPDDRAKLPLAYIHLFSYIKVYNAADIASTYYYFGNPWDIVIIDTCGRVNYHYNWPQSSPKLPFVSDSVFRTIHRNDCGKCLRPDRPNRYGFRFQPPPSLRYGISREKKALRRTSTTATTTKPTTVTTTTTTTTTTLPPTTTTTTTTTTTRRPLRRLSRWEIDQLNRRRNNRRGRPRSFWLGEKEDKDGTMLTPPPLTPPDEIPPSDVYATFKPRVIPVIPATGEEEVVNIPPSGTESDVNIPPAITKEELDELTSATIAPLTEFERKIVDNITPPERMSPFNQEEDQDKRNELIIPGADTLETKLISLSTTQPSLTNVPTVETDSIRTWEDLENDLRSRKGTVTLTPPPETQTNTKSMYLAVDPVETDSPDKKEGISTISIEEILKQLEARERAGFETTESPLKPPEEPDYFEELGLYTKNKIPKGEASFLDKDVKTPQVPYAPIHLTNNTDTLLPPNQMLETTIIPELETSFSTRKNITSSSNKNSDGIAVTKEYNRFEKPKGRSFPVDSLINAHTTFEPITSTPIGMESTPDGPTFSHFRSTTEQPLVDLQNQITTNQQSVFNNDTERITTLYETPYTTPYTGETTQVPATNQDLFTFTRIPSTTFSSAIDLQPIDELLIKSPDLPTMESITKSLEPKRRNETARPPHTQGEESNAVRTTDGNIDNILPTDDWEVSKTNENVSTKTAIQPGTGFPKDAQTRDNDANNFITTNNDSVRKTLENVSTKTVPPIGNNFTENTHTNDIHDETTSTSTSTSTSTKYTKTSPSVTTTFVPTEQSKTTKKLFSRNNSTSNSATGTESSISSNVRTTNGIGQNVNNSTNIPLEEIYTKKEDENLEKRLLELEKRLLSLGDDKIQSTVTTVDMNSNVNNTPIPDDIPDGEMDDQSTMIGKNSTTESDETKSNTIDKSDPPTASPSLIDQQSLLDLLTDFESRNLPNDLLSNQVVDESSIDYLNPIPQDPMGPLQIKTGESTIDHNNPITGKNTPPTPGEETTHDRTPVHTDETKEDSQTYTPPETEAITSGETTKSTLNVLSSTKFTTPTSTVKSTIDTTTAFTTASTPTTISTATSTATPATTQGELTEADEPLSVAPTSWIIHGFIPETEKNENVAPITEAKTNTKAVPRTDSLMGTELVTKPGTQPGMVTERHVMNPAAYTDDPVPVTSLHDEKAMAQSDHFPTQGFVNTTTEKSQILYTATAAENKNVHIAEITAPTISAIKSRAAHSSTLEDYMKTLHTDSLLGTGHATTNSADDSSVKDTSTGEGIRDITTIPTERVHDVTTSTDKSIHDVTTRPVEGLHDVTSTGKSIHDTSTTRKVETLPSRLHHATSQATTNMLSGELGPITTLPNSKDELTTLKAHDLPLHYTRYDDLHNTRSGDISREHLTGIPLGVNSNGMPYKDISLLPTATTNQNRQYATSWFQDDNEQLAPITVRDSMNGLDHGLSEETLRRLERLNRRNRFDRPYLTKTWTTHESAPSLDDQYTEVEHKGDLQSLGRPEWVDNLLQQWIIDSSLQDKTERKEKYVVKKRVLIRKKP